MWRAWILQLDTDSMKCQLIANPIDSRPDNIVKAIIHTKLTGDDGGFCKMQFLYPSQDEIALTHSFFPLFLLLLTVAVIFLYSYTCHSAHSVIYFPWHKKCNLYKFIFDTAISYFLKVRVLRVRTPPIFWIFCQILGWERGTYQVCTVSKNNTAYFLPILFNNCFNLR